MLCVVLQQHAIGSYYNEYQLHGHTTMVYLEFVRRTIDYRFQKIWFYNGFTAAGLILIIYSSSMEIQGAMHEFAIPVVHIGEVAIVLWVANRMIKYDEQEKLRLIELSHFPSTVDGSI